MLKSLFKFYSSFFKTGQDELKVRRYNNYQLNQVCVANHYTLVEYLKVNSKVRTRCGDSYVVYHHTVSSRIGLTGITTYHDKYGKIVHFIKTI